MRFALVKITANRLEWHSIQLSNPKKKKNLNGC